MTLPAGVETGHVVCRIIQAVIDGPEEDRDPDGRPVQLDTTAPDGYETAEVSAAKTIVGDILGTGVYALTGDVAAEVGGAAWAPFLVAFAIALVTAFSTSSS